MAFDTKKSVVATPSFSERMASIKSMFETTVKVTKEDTPGIRTIWGNIHSGQVFTVCFKK